MTAMLLRSILSAGVLAGVLAAPASAAPVLTTPLMPCYVVATEAQRQLITVTASGFTPFADVEILLDSLLQYKAKALLDGTLEGKIRAPFQEEGTRAFELRIAEVGTPGNTLVVPGMVTRLAVEQTPSSASTDQRVRFRGRGFTELTKPVYAHYIFAGQVRRSVPLGLPKGPCGTFSVRRKQFPFKRSPSVGRWTIQFDQNPQYSATAAVRVPMTIRVKRTPKRAPAPAR